jgi:hypothetical protein
MDLKDTLNKGELRKLAVIMDRLEHDALEPYSHVSGCFAEAVMYNYDDDIVDIELTFGVQSDCTNTVHSENITIDRSDL